MASNKNIMSGILLAPGPIATRLNVKNMSPAFQLGVSKAKFMLAANQLQDAGLGSLVVLDKISSKAYVFVKKPPGEMRALLESEEHLCNIEEYEDRYNMPTPASVTQRMKACLIEKGLLQQEVMKVVLYSNVKSETPEDSKMQPIEQLLQNPQFQQNLSNLQNHT